MSLTKLSLGLKVGLAFWLLLAPGENWTWIIVGGHDVQHACERERNERLDGDYLVCVATPSSTVAQPTTAYQPTNPRPRERGPSPGLTSGEEGRPSL
jgi:hypothetical protein